MNPQNLEAVARPFAAALIAMSLPDDALDEAQRLTLIAYDADKVTPVHHAWATYILALRIGHGEAAAESLAVVRSQGLEAAGWQAVAHLRACGAALRALQQMKTARHH